MKNRNAFTLLERLVVVATSAILMWLVGPALTRTKPTGQSIQCLSNTRRLIGAWQMYAQDYHDKMVINLHGSAAQGGAGYAKWGVGWCEGWLDWGNRSDNTNVLFLTWARWAKLGPYLNASKNVFKCPADRYASAGQRSFGWTERVRSYSCNVVLGEGNYEEGPTDSLYRHLRKTTEFIFPQPAEVLVFVDEHPDSITDPALFNPHRSSFIDIPATYHNGGCAAAFADGHSELHKWVASLASERARQVKFTDGSDMPGNMGTVAGDADLHWVSYHSPRNSDTSY